MDSSVFESSEKTDVILKNEWKDATLNIHKVRVIKARLLNHARCSVTPVYSGFWERAIGS